MQNVDAGRPPHAILSPTSVPGASRRRLAVDEHQLQQLLKEEMRLSILSKRHARGRSEAKLDCSERLIHEMNLADLERKERRREQNRRAAQRCRRKKRMNQLSVLQNYEWIITRNQQLQQEVNHLRHEMTRLNSLLKAHRNACTCTHVQKGPLHAQTANVKLEPGERSPGPEAGYRTPPLPLHSLPQPSPACVSRCLAMSSCQFEPPVNENVVSDMSGSALLQQHNPSNPQLNTQQPSFYASPLQTRNPSYASPTQASTPQNESCVSHKSMKAASHAGPPSFPITSSTYSMNYQAHEKERHHVTDLNSSYSVPAVGENPLSMQLAGRDLDRPQEEYRGSMAAFGPARTERPSQHPPIPDPDGPFALLEDLVGASNGVEPCLFQAEPVTPLSADGRRSISSVSSDVSSGSELPSSDVVMRTGDPPGDPLGELYDTDDMAPHDLSQLLSQINQSDLLFQQGGGLEEVFADQAVGIASLPEHFLHTL